MSWLGVPPALAVVLSILALSAWWVPLASARRPSGWCGGLLMGLRAGWLAAALVLALGVRWPLQPDSRPVLVALHAHGGDTLPAHWRDAFHWRQVRLAGGPAGAGSRRATEPLQGPLDLGAALEELAGGDRPPDGFVLFGSADPAGVRHTSAPLFVMQERDRDGDRQLHLLGLGAPKVVVPRLPFEVSVRFEGGSHCDGENWTVRLLGPAGEEQATDTTCEAAAARAVELRSAPPSPGSWDYRLEWYRSAAAPEGRRSLAFAVQATADPVSVLFLEEAPGWEATFLRRTVRDLLGADPHTLARLSPRHLFRGPDLQAPEEGFGLESLQMARFRLLILRDPVLTAADARWIRRFVADRGGALVLLGPAPQELEPLAPLPSAEDVAQGAGAVAATRLGRSHPILREVGEELSSVAPLQLEVSPAATLPLATQVLATAGGHPLVAVRRFGGGRVLQLAAPETYRWKLRGEASAAIYDALWRAAFTWLVETAAPRQRIHSTVPAAIAGTRVPLQVEWRDERFQPEASPARLQAGPVLLPVPFRPGSFQGWVTLAETRRKVALEGAGPAEGLWLATQPASQASPGRSGLLGVASRSGGRILYPDDPPPEIEAGAGPSSSVAWKRARDSFWPPVILLALAAAEWGARRRWGCEG